MQDLIIQMSGEAYTIFSTTSKQMTDRLIPYALFFLIMGVFLLSSIFLGALPIQVRLIGMEIIAFGGVALFFRKIYQQDRTRQFVWPTFRSLNLNWKMLVFLLVLGPIFGITANAQGGLIVELFGLQEMAKQQSEQVMQMLQDPNPWLAFAGAVSVVCFAPFFEEAAFRATILPASERVERVGVAIFINGLLFGAMHLSPISLLPLTLLGMVLADVTIRTRSIWPAILLHAALNACNGLVIPRLVPNLSETSTQTPLWAIALFATVMTLVSAALWWAFRRQLSSPSEADET